MSSPIIVQSGATPIIRPDNAIHSNLSGRSSADSHPTSAITGLDAALALKAPLASPALTGVPTAPTAAADTSTTQIATTAFAKAEADAAQAYAIQRANHTGTQTASTISDFSSAAQSAAAPVVQSANFTAASGTEYIAIATLTVTDPTPSVGANFIVHVRNGTATIGGVGYIAGQDVHRVWHSGSWNSTVQASLGTAQTWTALQTLGAGLTVSSGTTAMQAATCTTLTASGKITGGSIGGDMGLVCVSDSSGGAGIEMNATAASGGGRWRFGDGVVASNGTFVLYDYVGGAKRYSIDPSGTFTLHSATASTSTTTGALVVTGGIGAGGAGYFGGVLRAGQYVDSYSAFNVVSYFRLYALNALRGTFEADSGEVRVTSGGTTRISMPTGTQTVQFPVSCLIGSGGVVGGAPMHVSPSSWPTAIPTADQIGVMLGRKDDGTASYRTIGAGYYYGATYAPCIFGYVQTSVGGYTFGDWFVATRASGSDVAPTVRLNVKADGTVECLATTASTSTTTGALTVAGGVGIAKEVVLTASSTGAVYWGPTGTDGSVRCYGNGSGAMIFEKRSGGSWTEIGRFG